MTFTPLPPNVTIFDGAFAVLRDHPKFRGTCRIAYVEGLSMVACLEKRDSHCEKCEGLENKVVGRGTVHYSAVHIRKNENGEYYIAEEYDAKFTVNSMNLKLIHTDLSDDKDGSVVYRKFKN
jgi:hypothetical protein